VRIAEKDAANRSLVAKQLDPGKTRTGGAKFLIPVCFQRLLRIPVDV
jgi:hypothetical protein